MEYKNVERELIQYIADRAMPSEGIPGLGMGDDAAFLLLSSMDEGKLVITTDSVVENVHFKKEWCTYTDVALKLVDRSCSDILAKGGHPHWALLNMNITPEFLGNKAFYVEFVDTFCRKLKDHHIALIGGDVTRSAVNSFTLTVLGNTSTFIRRKNPEVQVGDLVVIYGKTGGSTLALETYAQGHMPENDDARYYRRPEACWQNSWLRDLEAKVSMDQSDSLFETFDTIAHENGIELTIDLDLVPLHSSMQKSLEGKLPQECAYSILRSAEDLAIVAIIPAAFEEKARNMQNLCIAGVVSKSNAQNIIYRWKKNILEIKSIPGLFEHF